MHQVTLKKTDTSNLVCTTNALQHLPILCQTIYGNLYAMLCQLLLHVKSGFHILFWKELLSFFFCSNSSIRCINYSADKTQSFSCNRNVIKFIWPYGYFSSSNKDLKNATESCNSSVLITFLILKCLMGF